MLKGYECGRTLILAALTCAWFGVSQMRAQSVGHGVSAAYINVVQYDTNNTAGSVAVSTMLSINQFSIRPGSSRGDFNVQIGDGFSDDSDNGILISSVAENGRNNGELFFPGTNYCTSTVDASRTGSGAGGYYVSTFNSPTGAEYNINVSAAFFPYSKWLGGLARNSGATNAGVNDLFVGSPGLILGTHFVDNGGGVSTVNLTNLGIYSQSNGVLLVTHGKNEDNYASSAVNANGTWSIYIKDNGTDTSSHEQDPVAFVYIPRTNTTVVSGRFRGDATVLMYSGASLLFTVTNISAGRWRLKIPGYSPSTGVLVISAEGGSSQNQDNIVSFQPESDGWLIESRDLPGNPPSLQTPGSGLEAVASFVFIPAPATANLITPADNAQNLPKSPSLLVAVSNSTPGSLTVKFYGRPAPFNPQEDFEIIAFPDTQFYVSSLNGGVPAMFYAQAEWVITNRISRNIAYVAHLGDVSQNGDLNGASPNTTEWRNATNAMYRIENPVTTMLAQGIPYGVAVGNHDEEPIGDATGTTTFFNQYFGLNHFNGRSYFAGHYGTNNNNHFDLFSAGGMDFIVIYFQYDDNMSQAVLNWGNDVLRTNANRRAIIVTHNFGNTATPLNFSDQGLAIYEAVKTNANVFMMLAGHVTGQGVRVDTYNGNTIRTFVSDYQGWTNGGNGFLRIISFSPTNNEVVLQTYSPWTGEYNTDPNSELFFHYDMQTAAGGPAGAPFTALATNTGVAPGAITSCTWPGLQYYSAYEWYVTITDSQGNVTTGPTWRFSTASNAPPIVTNSTITIYGDAPTNLTLQAYDVNGDPLTFQTNSLPLRGVLNNFNPTAGTVTYIPVRGSRSLDGFAYTASDGVGASAPGNLTIFIAPPLDIDANGLPDAWETSYGVTNALADNDGDGQNNLQEYFAGTNPTNAASALRITSTSLDPGGSFNLAWSSVGGTRYHVQYANGSTNSGFPMFIDIARPLELEMDMSPYGSNSTQSFTDDFSLTGGIPPNKARYYRIKVVQ